MAYQPKNTELKTLGDCWGVTKRYGIKSGVAIDNYFEVADKILTMEKKYEKVVEAAKEVVDGVVIGQYGIEGYHKELHFMVAKLGKLIEAVGK